MATAIVGTKQLATTTEPPVSQAPKQIISSNFTQIVAQSSANGQRANRLTIDGSDHRNHNNNNNNNSSCISIGVDSNCYKIGDLVWAKVNNHPWWPCRISKDLNESYFRYEEKILMYHVDFIGPVHESGWALEINIFKYDGIESFKTYAQDQVDRACTKAEKEKLAERFQLKVSLNRRENWQKAVDSADNLIRAIKNGKSTGQKRKRDESCDDRTSSSMESIDAVSKKFEKAMNSNNKHAYENDVTKMTNFHGNLKEEDEYEDEDEIDQDEDEDEDDVDQNNNHINNVKNEQDNEDDQENTQHRLVNMCSNTISNQPGYSVETNLQSLNKSKSYAIKKSSAHGVAFMRKQNQTNKPSFYNNQFQSTTTINNDSLIDNDSTTIKLKIKLNGPTSVNAPINRSRSNSSTSSTHSSVSYSTSSTNSAALYTGIKKPTSNANTSNASKNRQRKSKSFSVSDSISTLNDNSIQMFSSSVIGNGGGGGSGGGGTTETYLIDRYKYAVRHIQQGLSVEEACNKYRISKGALLKCLSGGTAPRGKKTRLTETEENEIVQWLISYKDLKYNDAIHLVFEQVVRTFEQTQRPNPFNNGKPSMDWWYDFLSRHPQIMASKPDWLMRGKVNDKYIQDVQSGQLKCTKFRRALLSAIQYINSINENGAGSSTAMTANSQNSMITPGSSFSVQNSQENYLVKTEKKTSKKNTKYVTNTPNISTPDDIEDDNGGAARLNLIHSANLSNSQSASINIQSANTNAFSSQITNSMIMNANSDEFDDSSTKQEYFINSGVNDVDHQSSSTGYLNHHSHQLTHHQESEDPDEREDEPEEEDDEDIEDEDQTDATFDNELFSTALEDHQFDSLIDPSTTVVSGTSSSQVVIDAPIHMHSNGTDSSTSPSAADAYFSGHSHHQYINSVNDIKSAIYPNSNCNQMYSSSPPISYSHTNDNQHHSLHQQQDQLHQHHHQHSHPMLHPNQEMSSGAQQHLLVPDDDDDQGVGVGTGSTVSGNEHHYHVHHPNQQHHHQNNHHHHHHHHHHLQHHNVLHHNSHHNSHHHNHNQHQDRGNEDENGVSNQHDPHSEGNTSLVKTSGPHDVGGRSLINDDEDDDELMVNTIDPSAFLP